MAAGAPQGAHLQRGGDPKPPLNPKPLLWAKPGPKGGFSSGTPRSLPGKPRPHRPHRLGPAHTTRAPPTPPGPLSRPAAAPAPSCTLGSQPASSRVNRHALVQTPHPQMTDHKALEPPAPCARSRGWPATPGCSISEPLGAFLPPERLVSKERVVMAETQQDATSSSTPL